MSGITSQNAAVCAGPNNSLTPMTGKSMTDIMHDFIMDDNFHDCLMTLMKTNFLTKKELVHRRLSGILPPDLIKNKTILDIGSCNGLVGAWCLSNGAKHYTGIEIQKELHDNAVKCFGKNFSKDCYTLYNKNINDFFTHDLTRYDIIVFFRVLQITPDWQGLLKTASDLCDDIIIENTHPHIYAEMLAETYRDDSCFDTQDRDLLHTLLESRIFKKKFRELLEEKLPVMHYRISDSIFVSNDCKPDAVTIMANYPSLGLFRNWFDTMSWRYHGDLYAQLKESLPDVYGFPHGFVARFTSTQKDTIPEFAEYFQSGMIDQRLTNKS